MNSYCYIFLLRNKEVSVYRFRNGNWEPVTRDGEESFPFRDTRELIDWWKDEACYVKGNEVDLLFLSDEPDTEWDSKLLQETFPFVKEKSVWSFSRLKDFFTQFNEMERVGLVVSKTSKPCQIKNISARPAPDGVFQFYTFPQLEEYHEGGIKEPEATEPADSTPVGDTDTGPIIEADVISSSSAQGDGTGDLLFQYFRSNLENYEK